MNSNPNIFSVVIPFYNGLSFLGDLLTSLNKSYEKSLQLFVPEIIIINDSPQIPEQNIRTICNQSCSEISNIKIFTNPENRGVAYSRDYGTQQASGHFITWIDQDDFVHESYFRVLEQRLQSQKNVYLLNGYICKETANNAIPVFYIKPTINFKRILFSNPVLSTSFWVVNREFLKNSNIRFYLPELIHKGVDDWFFSLQLTKNSLKFEYISNRLISYRFHETNFGHDITEATNGSIELLNILLSDDSFPKQTLQSRIKTFEFSKRFYSTGKVLSILSEPFGFARFLIHYSYDPNRTIRLFHKLFRQTNFRP
ncbi:MAG: glycosyltransferase [Bacteroidales bacterium]|nr:glycosyltransferase [Bacteroidales bacterium]